MSKTIETFLNENPNPSDEDLANFVTELEAEVASNPTPTADKLMTPGAATHESSMFQPTVPANPETSPKKQKVQLNGLYQLLDYHLTHRQGIFGENSPVMKKELEGKFELDESVSTQLIDKLKKLRIIESNGEVNGEVNKENLEKELKDKSAEEFWEFDGENYEQNLDKSIISTKNILEDNTSPTKPATTQPDNLSVTNIDSVQALEPGQSEPVTLDTITPTLASESSKDTSSIETSPIETEILSDQITFTNKKLFEILKESLGQSINVDYLSNKLKITPELAYEIIEVDLKHKGQSGEPIIKNDNTVNVPELEKVGQSLYKNNEMDKLYYLSSLPVPVKIIPDTTSDVVPVTPTSDPTIPTTNPPAPAPTIPASPTINPSLLEVIPTPTTGPLPPEATAGGEIETGTEDKEKWRSVKIITDLYCDLFKKYPKGTAAALMFVGALTVGGTGYNLYKNSVKEGNTASAPDNKNPLGGNVTNLTPSQEKNNATNSTPEKNISSVILNPKYEETRWWMDINPEVQKEMKEIITSENAKMYGLQFFKQIEFLNVSGYININDKTRSDLYDTLDRVPEILNLSFGDTPRIAECEVTLEDNITKQKKACYLRTNLSEIAKNYHNIIGMGLGGNMMEMFPQGQKLSDSYAWMRAKIIAEINAKAK